ncbi:MAG: hydrogenase maturation protease [Acidimicrobiia bacterium]|nr:hydrogenase maturation protease [Acidimicrobiia bacterium]
MRIVIGVGNPFRSDDAAGLEVARRLSNVTAYESSLGGFELMDLWQGAEEVVIVDAMHSKSAPGTIRVYNPLEQPLPAATFASSHAIGVAETIEMARRLDRLPASLSVYGIEAENLTSGTDVSPAVAAAVDRVVEELDHA